MFKSWFVKKESGLCHMLMVCQNVFKFPEWLMQQAAHCCNFYSFNCIHFGHRI